MSITISLKPPGASWLTIGELGSPRVVPSSVSLQADEFGSLQASFLLTARPEPSQALIPFTPCRIEIEGLRVWSGFVRVATQHGRQVAVECSGQQAMLDGDLLQLVMGDARLTSWDNSLCVAGRWSFQGQQQVGTDAIVISWPNDTSTVTAGASEFNGVTYLAALHQVNGIRVTAAFSQSIGARFVVVAHDELSVPSVGGLRIIDVPDTTSGVFAANTGGQFYRFISVGYTGTPATIPNGTQVTIPSIVAFDRAAYGAVILGSDVAHRVRELIPQLSSDESQIRPTSVSIPHIERTDADTGRSILVEAAAYDDALVQVDPFDRLVFRARDRAATVEFGAQCPASQESPQDPANLASAVDVIGTTVGGVPIRRRYAIPDDPAWPVRPSGATIPNPDFAVNVAGWTPTAGTVLSRGTTSPPPGLASWAAIQNASNPAIAWPAGESVAAHITGPMLAGVAYRVDLWAFDNAAVFGGLFKALTITLRLVDVADPQGLVESTLRLNQSAVTPYPWKLYSTTWVPRFDVANGYVILWNTPLVPSFDDGAVASPAAFPCFSGVRIYSADTLLGRQRVQRVGQVQAGTIASSDVSRAIGVTFLRERNRLLYVGTRECADGAAKDARTGAPLPAAALLGMTGRPARVADRLDPATGAVGANAYVSAVTYDGASRKASVVLGERYGQTAKLVQDLTP